MILKPYQLRWQDDFRAIAMQLKECLGNAVVAIHHVGSTSIPELPAKPIIDLDLEIAAGTPIDDLSVCLQSLGYEFEGDKGVLHRYAYRAIVGVAYAWPAHHLYACPTKTAELWRHLAFRDALVANGELRHAYLLIKREAERLSCGDRKRYQAYKDQHATAFVEQVLQQCMRSADGAAE